MSCAKQSREMNEGAQEILHEASSPNQARSLNRKDSPTVGQVPLLPFK